LKKVKNTGKGRGYKGDSYLETSCRPRASLGRLRRRKTMTRREQIRANRKSLARLHALECHQWIMHKINSVEKKEDDDQ
jgi:hypothetical protein